MDAAASPQVANGKLFAVAPMMDGKGSFKMSMSCQALYALRVQ
jgi:hypothetical protein